MKKASFVYFISVNPFVNPGRNRSDFNMAAMNSRATLHPCLFSHMMVSTRYNAGIVRHSEIWKVSNQEKHMLEVGRLELAILRAIAAAPDGRLSGYQIAEATLIRHAGLLYPALIRLESAGLLSSEWADMPAPRRRLYSLTEKCKS